MKGMPKREIQVPTNACRTVSAVMSAIGTASSQRVVLSTIVNRYLKPWSREKGPTMSMCMWPKRSGGTGIGSMVAFPDGWAKLWIASKIFRHRAAGNQDSRPSERRVAHNLVVDAGEANVFEFE